MTNFGYCGCPGFPGADPVKKCLAAIVQRGKRVLELHLAPGLVGHFALVSFAGQEAVLGYIGDKRWTMVSVYKEAVFDVGLAVHAAEPLGDAFCAFNLVE